MIHGVPIIVSDHALQDTDERLFPASKNRSRRIRKKLLKRFGGEFRKEPCAFKVGDKLIVHPMLMAKLREHIEHDVRVSHDRAFMNIYTGKF